MGAESAYHAVLPKEPGVLGIAAQPLVLIDLVGSQDVCRPQMSDEMRGREFALTAVDPGNAFDQRILAQPALANILLQRFYRSQVCLTGRKHRCSHLIVETLHLHLLLVRQMQLMGQIQDMTRAG